MAKEQQPQNDPSKGAMTTTTTAPGGAMTKYKVLDVKENFPLLVNGEEAIEVMKENLAGQAVGDFDLTIIKVPSQGATNWEVPTLNGSEAMKYVEGIVIGITRRRAFWKDPNPAGTPPDCGSADLEHGVGDPGGDCAKCPMAVFGSAVAADGKERRGQACRENKLIALLMAHEPMPVILKVPPSSLKSVLQFQTKLPVRFSGAIVRFGLMQDKSSDGIKYSKIVPELVGALPPDQAKLVQEFARTFRGQLDRAADVAAATADMGGE